MVNAEKLRKLAKQPLMSSILLKGAKARLAFVQGKTSDEINNEKLIAYFSHIITLHQIFVGTDSEVSDLKQLITLLEA